MTQSITATKPKTNQSGPYKLQVVDRALNMLALLGQHNRPMGLAQITDSLHLHKSTVHRFLMVLEQHHMVERTPDGSYHLGLRLYSLGNRAVQQYDLRDQATPHMRRLVTEVGETAHLCVREKALVVYLEKIEPSCSVRMTSRLGSTKPVSCTASGKAMLAALPEHELRKVLPLIDNYVKLTRKSVGNEQELLRDLEATRRRGYAIDDEEAEVGLRCIAAAIRDRDGNPVGAISVSGPSFRMTPQKMKEVTSRVLECVRAIAESRNAAVTDRAAGKVAKSSWHRRHHSAAGATRMSPAIAAASSTTSKEWPTRTQ